MTETPGPKRGTRKKRYDRTESHYTGLSVTKSTVERLLQRIPLSHLSLILILGLARRGMVDFPGPIQEMKDSERKDTHLSPTVIHDMSL